MCARLSASLIELAKQARDHVTVPLEQFESACAEIASGRARPEIFAVYCELVFALHAGELDRATRLFEEIANNPSRPNELKIWRLKNPELDLVSRRYVRLFDTDPDQPFDICPPNTNEADACEKRIRSAIDLLARCDPAAHEELRIFLKEIVLAVGAGSQNALTFDGASSFMLFGAILLNANGHDTVLQTLEALIHESSHNLLFGLCADGAMVVNSGDERFESPLRVDARPMDGIVHATFVLGRMHVGIRRLLDSNGLDEAQANEARTLLIISARNYMAGWDTIERHARLTLLGQRIIGGMHRCMVPYLTAHGAKS